MTGETRGGKEQPTLFSFPAFFTFSSLLRGVRRLRLRAPALPCSAMSGGRMKLTYFGTMAKGLGPAICCEVSGLAWDGPQSSGWDQDWQALKESGKPPFGQVRTPYLPVYALTCSA